MGFYQFNHVQKFNCTPQKIWDFISRPQNLKDITPDYMGFDIQTKNIPEKMYEGMIICYKVSPLLGIKTTWVTEITHLKENKYFIDEQRVGPYKLWHHQHILEEVPDGTIMKDTVSYCPPMGFLGSIANTLIIKRKINEIFKYRESALNKHYIS